MVSKEAGVKDVVGVLVDVVEMKSCVTADIDVLDGVITVAV